MAADYAIHGLAIGTAAVAVLVTVLLMFEGMVRLGRMYQRHRSETGGPVRRERILFLVLGLIALHTGCIVVFGTAFWFLMHVPGAGAIEGASHATSMFDAFYMSAMTYSTVGFGDLTPKGPIRWLAGTESLVGLMMVAWSASFAFMEMSRHWRDDVH